MTDNNVDLQAVLVKDLADFRRRILKGEEVTDEELRDSIKRLRMLRDKTAKPLKAKSDKKAATKLSATEAQGLLGDLLG